MYCGLCVQHTSKFRTIKKNACRMHTNFKPCHGGRRIGTGNRPAVVARVFSHRLYSVFVPPFTFFQFIVFRRAQQTIMAKMNESSTFVVKKLMLLHVITSYDVGSRTGNYYF